MIELELKQQLVAKKKEKKKKDKKQKAIDNLFKRIFLSSLLLLLMVLSDAGKVPFLSPHIINDHFNFWKFTKIFNQSLGIIDSSVEDPVFNSDVYEFVTYDGKINLVENFTTNSVTNLTSGVVIKIEKNKGLYNIYIQDKTGVIYGYLDLEQINVHIYDYVDSSKIIATANYNDQKECYTFKVEIKDKEQYCDYYEKAED